MDLSKKTLLLLLGFIFFGGLFPEKSESGQLPLWEAAVGMVGFSFPDYRGSDQGRFYLLPFPYFIYRGEVLKVDRDRVRGLFFRRPWLELDLSLGGSFPVDSSQNDARKGMPDLYPAVELGPSLELILGEKKGDYKTTVTLPFRFAGAIHFPQVYGIGWVFTPRLNIDKYDIGGWSGYNLGMSLGPVIGSDGYHDYFYSVRPAYATPSTAGLFRPGRLWRHPAFGRVEQILQKILGEPFRPLGPTRTGRRLRTAPCTRKTLR